MKRRWSEIEIPPLAADLLDIRQEPGWRGFFTRSQAPGAIPNGARIVKCLSVPNDTHANGARGTVLGSIRTPQAMQKDFPGVAFSYFVEWDDMPREGQFVLGSRIKPVDAA